MILNDKFVEAYSSTADQMNCAAEMDENSLAIIISVEGSYMYRCMEIVEELKKNNVKVVLITQNTHSKFASLANRVLECGCSNNNNEGRLAVMYLIELLIMRYGILYK